MGNPVETQNRLIAAARRIIIDEGIEAASVEHICRVAGFSRGAFYANYTSKDDLLLELAEEEYDGLIERLRHTADTWADSAAEADTPDTSTPGRQRRVMEQLLTDVLGVIGMDRTMYLLHSEFLMRSTRNPEWSLALRRINEDFVEELGNVLVDILDAAGRVPLRPIPAMTQAVIGVVMRVACIAGLQEATMSALAHACDGGETAPRAESAPAEATASLSPSARLTADFIVDILVLSSASACG